MTEALPREEKRVAGRTETPRTPLNVRTTGFQLAPEERGYLRVRLGKKLGKFAPHIERVTVRFEDLNGPKGGVDIECRIKVVLSGLPSVVVTETAETVQAAFNLAADRAVRAAGKAIRSSGTRTPKVARRAAQGTRKGAESSRPARAAKAGSLIGRRVGQGRANLLAAAERPEKESRAFPVDTSLPGQSATARKVGAGATATRNTRLRDRGAVYALEDSMQPRPSRKSTRRSAGGVKTDSQLRKRTMREVRAPGTRAERATAQGRGSGKV